MAKIRFTAHALRRLEERSHQFGISPVEFHKRIRETILLGRCSKSSIQNKVYCRYYNDNLSFFVVCKRMPDGFKVETVIIKIGRE